MFNNIVPKKPQKAKVVSPIEKKKPEVKEEKPKFNFI